MILAVALVCLSVTVVDGDTFDCAGERIRIANIDAPETRGAKCEAELMLGSAATRRLREILAEGIVRIEREKRLDRYGRTVARISTPRGDVGQRLIDERYARPWRGRREPWCVRPVSRS